MGFKSILAKGIFFLILLVFVLMSIKMLIIMGKYGKDHLILLTLKHYLKTQHNYLKF